MPGDQRLEQGRINLRGDLRPGLRQQVPQRFPVTGGQAQAELLGRGRLVVGGGRFGRLGVAGRWAAQLTPLDFGQRRDDAGRIARYRTPELLGDKFRRLTVLGGRCRLLVLLVGGPRAAVFASCGVRLRLAEQFRKLVRRVESTVSRRRRRRTNRQTGRRLRRRGSHGHKKPDHDGRGRQQSAAGAVRSQVGEPDRLLAFHTPCLSSRRKESLSAGVTRREGCFAARGRAGMRLSIHQRSLVP